MLDSTSLAADLTSQQRVQNGSDTQIATPDTTVNATPSTSTKADPNTVVTVNFGSNNSESTKTSGSHLSDAIGYGSDGVDPSLQALINMLDGVNSVSF